MCLVAEVMNKDEQYARGCIKLAPQDAPYIAELAQYALALMRLRRDHVERCAECKEGK